MSNVINQWGVEMTIYVDVLFLKEFLMNFMIAICTRKVLSKPFCMKRYLVACVIGSFSTILCLMIPFTWTGMIRISTIGMMVMIAYSPKNLMEWIKSLITFYLVTFVIAGISFYTIDEKLKRIIYILSFGLIIYTLIQTYEERYRVKEFTYLLKIPINHKEYTISTFLDTGNFLKSSLGEEVVIVSPRIVKKMKDDDFQNILLGRITKENSYQERVRIIPYESLGNPYGMKYGVKLEDISIQYHEEIIRKGAVVVMAEKDFINYDSIIGLTFLEGSDASKKLVLQTKGGKKNGNFIVNS